MNGFRTVRHSGEHLACQPGFQPVALALGQDAQTAGSLPNYLLIKGKNNLMLFLRAITTGRMNLPLIRCTLASAVLISLLVFLAGCASTPTRPDAKSPTRAAAPVSAAFPQTHDWVSLFDGKTLKGWAISDFSGHGKVSTDDGKITLGSGVMTGVTWTNDIPRMNFEVELEAMRVDGSDFFCGLTFPVATNPCSLIVGGWGGGVVGLSSLDGEDAANNETTKYINFENGRWYKIRLRVVPTTIQAWIDEEKIVDVVIADRRISIRIEVEPSVPFGISTWSTTGAIRNIRVRRL